MSRQFCEALRQRSSAARHANAAAVVYATSTTERTDVAAARTAFTEILAAGAGG